jgi:hypothetical protein
LRARINGGTNYPEKYMSMDEHDVAKEDRRWNNQGDGEGPESADEIVETPLTGEQQFTAYLREYGDTRPDGSARND